MTDQELVPLAARGDHAAFEALYATYYRLALRVAVQVIGPDRAEDAAQTTFLWLLEGRWRLREGYQGRLHGYVAALAKYAALQVAYVRRDSREQDREGYRAQAHVVPDPRPSPEALLVSRETQTAIVRTFRVLPPQLRRVARLRYLHALPGPTIGERLGLDRRTVPGYLQQIRKRLRPHVCRIVPWLPKRSTGRAGHVRYDMETRYGRVANL